MWLSRSAAILALLAIAGCGFTPVYGTGGSAVGLRGTVEVDPPSDPSGFALVRQLERRFGVASTPDYALSAQLFITEEELGITADQEITRYNLLGRARYSLRDNADGDIVTSGTVESFSSYSATGTPFSTESAQRDANERLMVNLADKITAQILATSGDWK